MTTKTDYARGDVVTIINAPRYHYTVRAVVGDYIWVHRFPNDKGFIVDTTEVKKKEELA